MRLDRAIGNNASMTGQTLRHRSVNCSALRARARINASARVNAIVRGA